MAHVNKERELLVCKTEKCGNVAYRVDADADAKMREYYRHSYREIPNHMNLMTTSTKLGYIQNFLSPWLESKKDLVCGDVGSATGYVPRWLRSLGHKATGCELTVSYRRFSEHFYGIPLTEELEPKHQYDLITVYHVLEHLPEPDKKLAHYVSLLKDDGRILVATPEWFNALEEGSGTPLYDEKKPRDGGARFRHLFHKDHINVFSEKKIKELFNKCGLSIEGEDHITYGQTYFLKKKTVAIDGLDFSEEWEQQVGKIEAAKKAIQLLNEEKFMEAIDVWPKFPEAWVHLIFDTHGKVPGKQSELFVEGSKHLQENVRLRLSHALWLYQQEKFDLALEAFKWLLAHRASDDVQIYIGYCLFHLGRYQEAIQCFFKAADINPQKWVPMMDWACKAAVMMPTWDERALGELKKKIEDENRKKIALVDPYMEKANAG